MNLLLDFLNVKTWTLESLFDLVKRYGLSIHIAGHESSYKKWIQSRAFPDRLFFSEFDDYAAELKGQGVSVVIPEDVEMYGELFEYLSGMQEEWRDRVKRTAEKGADVQFLNNALKLIRMDFIENENSPWKPQIFSIRGEWTTTFEDFIEFSYAYQFISGQGEQFAKLKTCRNPECRDLFIYNRSKQVFCCDACRHGYHNRFKVESGYLAEHQRKGRREKPLIYMVEKK